MIEWEYATVLSAVPEVKLQRINLLRNSSIFTEFKFE